MDNSYVILAIIFAAIVAVIGMKISNGSEKRKVLKNTNNYSYVAKKLMMSPTEAKFFMKLNSVVNERYFVFPQVHLSSLLDHRVKSQNWRGAFRHINEKSVDFVLCDKTTLAPAYALELDDSTHNRHDRVNRDIEVGRIFKEARLPLVRFKDVTVSDDEIIQALSKARSLTNV